MRDQHNCSIYRHDRHDFFQSALHFAVEESGNHKRIAAHPVPST